MALQEPVPPPPYMNPGGQKRSRWSQDTLQGEQQIPRISASLDMPNEDLSAGMKFLLLFPYIAVVGGLICLQIRRRIRSLLSSCLRNPLAPSSSTVVPNAQSVRIEPAPNMSEETTHYSTSVPSQSTSGLRPRKRINLPPNSTTWNGAEAEEFNVFEHWHDREARTAISSPERQRRRNSGYQNVVQQMKPIRLLQRTNSSFGP